MSVIFSLSRAYHSAMDSKNSTRNWKHLVKLQGLCRSSQCILCTRIDFTYSWIFTVMVPSQHPWRCYSLTSYSFPYTANLPTNFWGRIIPIFHLYIYVIALKIFIACDRLPRESSLFKTISSSSISVCATCFSNFLGHWWRRGAANSL